MSDLGWDEGIVGSDEQEGMSLGEKSSLIISRFVFISFSTSTYLERENVRRSLMNKGTTKNKLRFLLKYNSQLIRNYRSDYAYGER